MTALSGSTMPTTTERPTTSTPTQEDEHQRRRGILRPGGRRPGAGRSDRGRGRRIAHTLVWLLVGFNLFALGWMIVTSVREHRSIFRSPWSLPGRPQLENYLDAWTTGNFGPAAVNTVLLVGAASVTIVLISAPAAYALSRIPGRMSDSLSVLFALGIGVPAQVIIVPLFVIAQEMALVNSLPGLYVLYVALSLPFTVFLLTGFFRSLPGSLEEAAALDGASPFRTFWQIMLPLGRSGLITALALNAVGLWNETFLALVFVTGNENQTLSLALLGFLAKQQYSGADYGALFAGVCIIVLPMVALYVWLGRRIIEGLTLGADK
ncbi:carbohydrate ABC transporter permease [Streptomyces luteolus]|uniref:Carbohydrate ABC transporter permease n=1 Tax=Streptomyces luteolus TaxID=3043615 RepID=A0ABT6STR4_9ACTN|nr:carbohydrate ABC transporter permease [Streptomyces sp. B-S-A12]MDI3418741.1 carbohydrate ABC transporter permease [Streptomyces sp. B-S-A12]